LVEYVYFLSQHCTAVRGGKVANPNENISSAVAT